MNKADVIKAINTITDRIEQARKHRRSLTEEDTKVFLITPLLRALGWEVEDFHEVRFEYRHKKPDLPVDYALFLNRNPVLFIEAKALGSNLADHKWASQTIAYASAVGVTWCVLTDGDEYRLYNAHAPVEIQQKLFHTLKLSEVNAADATGTIELLSRDNMGENTLSTLWDAHFVDRQVKAVLEEMIAHQDASLVRLLHKRTKAITKSSIQKSLERAEAYFDFPILQSTTTPATETRPVPPPTPTETSLNNNASLSELIQSGLIRPPMEIETTYLKKRVTATVLHDGTISFNGQNFSSLSLAGAMARNHVKGPPPPESGQRYWPTNGWKFWRFKDPVTGSLRPIDELRKHT